MSDLLNGDSAKLIKQAMAELATVETEMAALDVRRSRLKALLRIIGGSSGEGRQRCVTTVRARVAAVVGEGPIAQAALVRRVADESGRPINHVASEVSRVKREGFIKENRAGDLVMGAKP
jgi:hypothetical protein